MRHGPRATALAAAVSLIFTFTAVAQPAGTTNLQPRVMVAGKKAEVSQWFRAESANFIVYSDAGEDDVALLLRNLEKLDHLLRAYALPDGQAPRPTPKLTLYFHNSATDLREVDNGLPADAVGLYSSCAAGVQGFGVHLERIPSFADAQLDKAPLDETLSYVFEAYARHFLYRHTSIRGPASFIDGFAQYFSSVRFSDRQMVVGRTPSALGQYLYFLNEGRRASLDYDDVLQRKLDNAKAYGGSAGVRLEYEAKAWLLTHYMLSSEDNRRRLSRYLLAVERGAKPVRAFERTFDVKPGELDKLMWRHGRLGTSAMRVEFPPALPAARVNITALPRATGEFLLAEAALKSCPGPTAGAALLKRVASLAARYPEDERARLTFSRAQIDWGDPEAAVAPLNAVLAVDAANDEAWHLLGLAELRQAERAAGPARLTHLQAARAHLHRARGLNPLSPALAYTAFKAELATAEMPSPESLQSVISAWQSSREVDVLARSAALAFAFTGQADEAQQALGSLADRADQPPLAEWAKQWQVRLVSGVSRREILAEMSRHPSPDTPFKEWTYDKKVAMQATERAAGLEAADSVLKELARERDADTGRSSTPAPR